MQPINYVQDTVMIRNILTMTLLVLSINGIMCLVDIQTKLRLYQDFFQWKKLSQGIIITCADSDGLFYFMSPLPRNHLRKSIPDKGCDVLL